jgi:hypothetical protein
MDTIYNGMPAGELGSDGWEKPWSGTNGGTCIEAKRLSDGRVAFRQSTDPTGPALVCTRGEVASFLAAAKAGGADFLIA